MSGRFLGKTVIITGSSNGIGRESAILFAEEGAQLTITGRNENDLKETRSLLVAAGAKDEDILEVVGDLPKPELAKEIVEKNAAKFGKIDILVNNAGCVGPDGAIMTEQGIEVYDYVMGLNTRSVVILCNYALPYLEKTRGEIVMVSSIVALQFASATSAYYSMSKAALDQFTRSLAAQYIEKGVRVNSVNPGMVQTTIMQKSGLSAEMASSLFHNLGKDRIKVPLGRCGVPRDIANAIAFLADRKLSEYIVGHFLIIDGGTHLMNTLLSVPVDQEKLAPK